MKVLVVLSLLVVTSLAASVKNRSFPKDFLFGTVTASYQIEGAWDVDGKGENIFDYMIHNDPSITSSGDTVGESYYNYKRDVEMMRELGLDAYRFSLSWSRILPTGFANEINPAGIDYYNNLVNEMLKYNIEPMITLYHWDLPQKLQELGGFTNPLIADWFEDYARVAFENFGDRVKYWITFNEPREFCYNGYGADILAPLVNATDVGTYLCAKHMVLSHANAYHAYNNDFKPTQGGKCGITQSVFYYEPLTDSDEDILAAEIKRQGEWGIYSDPIFSTEGGFPKEFSQRVAEKSAEQGYPRSRLPAFTEEERLWALGASDFFGVNHYTSYLVSATEYKTNVAVPSVFDDEDVGTHQPGEWPTAASSWLKLAPDSLYKVLTELQRRYNDPDFYITENGWSVTPDTGLIDDERITYYKAALENVLDSLDAGVKVKGYMAWSLMDNYEWVVGFAERFGLYHVDFEDPARTRTPRKSAFFYKQVIRNRYVDHEYEPESMTMTIDEGH